MSLTHQTPAVPRPILWAKPDGYVVGPGGGCLVKYILRPSDLNY
jgi:hypothetical protein